MPLHQSHTVQAGSHSIQVFLFAVRSDGSPAAGVDLTEVSAAYVRTGETAVAFAISPGTIGALTPGDIAEVDADLLPGVYQLAVPDAVIAAGAPEAVLCVRAPDATFDPVKFNLVAYDPQDAWSLGMTQLQDYKRHQVLRQALPRFTEMELELGKNNEQILADSLGETPPEWAQGASQ